MKDIKEKTIAVIGVSHKEEKFGFRIFNDLIKNGFDVVGVNPANGEILDRKIFRNLKEIDRPVDLIITVVPPRVTEKIVEEAKTLGVKEIWMQPGSESEKAIADAKKFGISITHSACFMVKNGIW